MNITDGSLVLQSELADVTGLSKQRVSQVVNGAGEPPFPKPTMRSRGGVPLWRVADVDKWNTKRKETQNGKG